MPNPPLWRWRRRYLLPDGTVVAIQEGGDVQDSRGRVRCYLGIGHPWANKKGWQYRARLTIAAALGHPLPPGIHAHHINGNRADDRRSNLEGVAAEYHGRAHACAWSVYRSRDRRGRFVRFDGETPNGYFPEGPFDWPRLGPILGPAAREER